MIKYLVAMAFLVQSTTANAQWIVESKEGAFDDKVLNMIVVPNSDGYGLGLRCTDASDLELVYIAPDASEGIDSLNVAKPLLKLRVDKQDIIQLPTRLESNGTMIKFLSEPDEALLKQISGAKKRVAVVVELLGQKMHEAEFGVVGSGTAMKKLAKSCQLAAP